MALSSKRMFKKGFFATFGLGRSALVLEQAAEAADPAAAGTAAHDAMSAGLYLTHHTIRELRSARDERINPNFHSLHVNGFLYALFGQPLVLDAQQLHDLVIVHAGPEAGVLLADWRVFVH